MTDHVDVLLVTDARLPGGTSASTAEEVSAQARAGYRTALLQVDSGLVSRPRPLAPRVRGCIERGELELLVGPQAGPGAEISADVVVLRHPTVAGGIDPDRLPRIRTSNRLMVANQAAGTPASASVAADGAAGPVAEGAGGDGVGGDGAGAAVAAGGGTADAAALRYDPVAVDRHVAAWLDGPVRWAPIGPLVRSDLRTVAPELPLEADDWVNVIDVDAWRQPRDGARHAIPVIGRHSRDDVLKWPASRAELLAAYPARDDVEVHVLGGAAGAERVLGGPVPRTWQVWPFGAVPPARFLAGLDLYVYQHHPAWVEAFGRSILEALASGLPTVLPPHFEPLFADAAVYVEPAGVQAEVRRLHADRTVYRALAQRATGFAADRFGHGIHVRRLAALATPSGRGASAEAAAPRAPSSPSASAETPQPEAPQPDAPTRAAGARRVLFVSSNGAGVGHLMRLMAYARHAPDDIEPLFLTFSQGGQVVDDAGYLVEYLASRSISGARADDWHPMLRERVGELIERHDVRAVVFDGTWPYRGLLEACADHPHVQVVWSRRAMWRKGVTNPVLESERDRFDLVLEPGELAGDDDRGATRPYRPEATRVGPVTTLEFEDQLDPAAAREGLGLDPDRPAALVHLGAGNIDDTSSVLGQVVARLAREQGLQVRVTRSIIAAAADDLPPNVEPLSIYPLARYLQAFDLAVAAPGYNSFHELMLAAVPTAFVPNLATSTDDQGARARFADRVGIGLDLGVPTAAGIDEALGRLLDPAQRRRMHERAVVRRQQGGAADAMAAIAAAVDTGPRDRIAPRQRELRADASRPTPKRLAPRALATPSAVDEFEPPEVETGSGAVASPSGASSDGAAVAADRSAAPPARVRPSLGALRRRLRRRIVRLARDGRVRRVVRVPFAALPTPARRVVRRRLRRWDRKAKRGTVTTAPILPVPVGSALGERAPGAVASVLIVIPTLHDAAAVDRIVARTAAIQVARGGFAPMFLVGDLAFRAARSFGYLVEYLPPRDRHDRVTGDEPWHAMRRTRLAAVIRWFAPDRVLTLPTPEEDGVDGLLAVLAAGLEGLDRPVE